MDKKTEIAFKKEDFERYFEQKSERKTLYGELKAILKTNGKNLNKTLFMNTTYLDSTIFDRLEKGEQRLSLKVIVTICITFKFSFSEINRFLNASGYILSLHKKKECAYDLLLSHPEWHNYDIKTCNEYLKVWGIETNDLLGSKGNI